MRPYHRPRPPAGGEAAPLPIIGADGRPEHEVQELLKLKMRWGLQYVLVRWAGRDASGGDTWEPLDNLTNCEEAIASFERATALCPAAPRRCRPPSPSRRRSRRQVSPWTSRHLATFVRRTWEGRSSAGDLRTVSSAEPSPACACVARSRTWWPTPGRRRRCEARRTRCSDKIGHRLRLLQYRPQQKAGTRVHSDGS